MANTKNPKPSTEDAMAAVSALIARAKRDGSIQATELTTELEKLDLPVEKIEHIYDTFDAMGIQIVSPELELDVSDDLGMDMDEVPDGDDEELVDPLELAAEYNLDDPVRMYLKEIGQVKLLTADEEKALIKQLAQYPAVVYLAARDYDPSFINRYLGELAAAFHKFYNACRIKGEAENVLLARLKLADTARAVLKNGMTLIGCSAPEKM